MECLVSRWQRVRVSTLMTSSEPRGSALSWNKHLSRKRTTHNPHRGWAAAQVQSLGRRNESPNAADPIWSEELDVLGRWATASKLNEEKHHRSVPHLLTPFWDRHKRRDRESSVLKKSREDALHTSALSSGRRLRVGGVQSEPELYQLSSCRCFGGLVLDWFVICCGPFSVLMKAL